MKSINKLILVIILILIPKNNVYASSIKITSSKDTINIGESVTVTATITADSDIMSSEGSVYCTGAGIPRRSAWE